MSEYLSPGELHHLTAYAQAGKHAVWLKEHAIPYRQDGSRVIVSREHVRAWLEGRTVASSSGLNLAGIK